MAIDSPGSTAQQSPGSKASGQSRQLGQSAAPGQPGVPAQPGSSSQQPTPIAEQFRNRASNALSQQKDRATEGLGSIVNAVRNTGRQLGDSNQNAVAGYVNKAADSLERWADTLQRKDIGEIVEDVQRFGRRQPALFIGLAIGAGLLGARFLKSSGRASYGGPYGGSYGDVASSYGERSGVTS